MSIQRINSGKGHWYKIDGKKADGVTTLIGNGFPKPALINWAANTTAGYAVDNWAELADLKPSERLERLKKARWSELDKAGKRGTEVHGLAERLSHGEEVEVPDELAGHIESAVKFLDEWRPEVLLTETTIGSRKWNYAGTLDAIYRLPDGRVVISDFKTSRSGIFGEVAMQLGAYANAEHYIDAEGDERPVSDLGIQGGIAVWVRADGYDVYEVDLDHGFKVFLHAAYIARQGKGLRERVISEALPAPTAVV